MFKAQSQLFPGWSQSFAVTTPWSEELDKVVAFSGEPRAEKRKRESNLYHTRPETERKQRLFVLLRGSVQDDPVSWEKVTPSNMATSMSS